MSEIFLTPKELAARWSMSVTTLAQWRKNIVGKGPKFVKIGGVRYPMSEVEKYESEKMK